MSAKWKTNECEGVLESKGNYFVELECTNRCEHYKDKKCPLETSVDFSKLVPAGLYDDAYYFNEKLLDYGEYQDFDGLKRTFNIRISKTFGTSLYYAEPAAWYAMLNHGRNLMFAVFSQIKGNIDKQRELIFSEFTVKDHWLPLIFNDASYLQDYRLLKNKKPDFSNNDWCEICKKYPHLYPEIVGKEIKGFKKHNMIQLLALYPHLDDKAYDAMKKDGLSGSAWTALLSESINKEGSEKFWNDCDFKTLQGNDWVTLLSKEETAALAKKNIKKEYGRKFSDKDWEILKQAGFASYFEHPRFMHFKPFFEEAPKNAAKAQFKSMFGIVLLFSFLFFAGTVLGTGNGGFFTGDNILVAAGFLLIWTAAITLTFACLKGGNVNMIVNAVIAGIFGGVIFPHILLLIGGTVGWHNQTSEFILGASFLIILLFLGVLFGISRISKIAVYCVLVLILCGYGILLSLPADKNLIEFCKDFQLDGGRRFYLNKYLEGIQYNSKWQEAYAELDVEKLQKVIDLYKPTQDLNLYKNYMENIVDVILDPKNTDETKKSFKDLLKNNFIGKDFEFVDNYKYIENYWENKIIKEENLSRKKGYAESFKELYWDYSPEVREHFLQLIENITEKNLSECCSIYSLLDNLTSEQEKSFKERLIEIGKNHNYKLKEGHFADFVKYIPENDPFWNDMMKNQINSPIFSKAVDYFRKRTIDLNEAVNAYNDKIGEEIEKRYRDAVNKLVKSSDNNAILSLSQKDRDHLKNYLKNEYYFWMGYAYYQQNKNNEAAEYWKQCKESIIRSNFSDKEIKDRIDQNLRNSFAENTDKETAIKLWKKCFDSAIGAEDKELYLDKILEVSKNEGRFLLQKKDQLGYNTLLKRLGYILKLKPDSCQNDLLEFIFKNYEESLDNSLLKQLLGLIYKKSTYGIPSDCDNTVKYLLWQYGKNGRWNEIKALTTKSDPEKIIRLLRNSKCKDFLGEYFFNLALGKNKYEDFLEKNNLGIYTCKKIKDLSTQENWEYLIESFNENYPKALVLMALKAYSDLLTKDPSSIKNDIRSYKARINNQNSQEWNVINAIENEIAR